MKRIMLFAIVLIQLLTVIGCQAKLDPDPVIDLDMTQIVRVHYFDRDSMFSKEEANAFYDEAFNRDLAEDKDSDIYHIPIFRFDTVTAWNTFNEKYRNLLKGYTPIDNTPSAPEQATQELNEAFFDTYTLFAVYVISGSGSYRFYVDGIETSERNLSVRIAQKEFSGMGTCDMAAWMAIVPIEKEQIKGYTSFDAIFVEN